MKRLFTAKNWWCSPAKHNSPLAEPACSSVLRILPVTGLVSPVAVPPSSVTGFCNVPPSYCSEEFSEQTAIY